MLGSEVLSLPRAVEAFDHPSKDRKLSEFTHRVHGKVSRGWRADPWNSQSVKVSVNCHCLIHPPEPQLKKLSMISPLLQRK